MFVHPDAAEVRAVAASLGIRLSTEECELYRGLLVAQLQALDDFVQSRAYREVAPPVTFECREPGHRPHDSEDPFNAWTWKCWIEGADEGLLAGRTVSFKDHISVAGIPLTFGSFAMDGFIPDFDASVVTRVLAAGGTITGKNVMNGFVGGFGFDGERGDYGIPLNPHDPTRVPGGSSSGSAVAVAAGEVDIAFGGDQGGSIRMPAAWCGILGLKPTFGLISHFGIGFGYEHTIDFTGPMARNVEDLAVALEAVAGTDGLDPRQGRDVPERLPVLGTLDRGVDGVRVGVLDEGFIDVDPDVERCVQDAIACLEAEGAVVSRISIPEHIAAPRAANALMAEGSLAVLNSGLFGALHKTYYPSSLIAAVNRLWAHDLDLFRPRAKFGYVLAEFSRRNFRGRVYAKAQNLRPTFIGAYDRALHRVDVLVMPTSPTIAPVRGQPSSYLDGVRADIVGRNSFAKNTKPFNYTGHPALAVPCGRSDGLPVSMQLVGRSFDDGLLLQVARAYERAVGWTVLSQ